jgi:hypothetical protein
LYVFLAREAPVGVVLRRGPSAWAQLTVWDTEGDVFAHGQWLRGRVYEDRCDLSPDGSLFLYFARKESARARAAGYGYAWTALSRPPYFTALALWPQDSTWLGGGVFRDGRTVELNGCGLGTHPDHPVPEGLAVGATAGRMVTGWSYQERLARDGWERVAGSPPPGLAWPSVARPPSVWRRVRPGGGRTLVMAYPGESAALPGGFGGYPVRFEVEGAEGGRGDKGTRGRGDGESGRGDEMDGYEPARMNEALAGATWADWDGRGRLVLAKEGRLLAWEAAGGGAGRLVALMDFNPLRPHRLAPPGWAGRWDAGVARGPVAGGEGDGDVGMGRGWGRHVGGRGLRDGD